MSFGKRRNVLLVQLPIPPLGPGPIRGNVPLAAGYLKLFAESNGLGGFYAIDILPAATANFLGDQALVTEILDRDPWLVGFTCYVWNIERTLWIAARLKERRPALRIVLGGPEITGDNAWVLNTPDYDFAVIGEGEQTFQQLLLGLLDDDVPPTPVAGLYVPRPGTQRYDAARLPVFRTPLADLNRLGSPYLAGILDAADEQMLLLETTRGCVFKCKFCYYPKSYDKQYYLSRDTILANLRHADDRGAREVFLLDPTLNQRKDFAELLRLLADGNPGRRFSYFGELRAEGITEEAARLLRKANFTEVEVGLQSIDPDAMHLMDRKNNLKAFERGVRAMLSEGISVKVDLIVGLPGDTVESVRRGLHYLHDQQLYRDVQVFNLSILPGTDFRKEAGELGLKFQPRPPYYVLQTPTLAREELYGLMQEAQDLFDIEFDAQQSPVLEFPEESKGSVWRINLERSEVQAPLSQRAQAFTLWLRSRDFDVHRQKIASFVGQILDANPFTTLQVVLDAGQDNNSPDIHRSLSPRLLDVVTNACQSRPTYLDKFYALQPGRPNGAKRLIVLLPVQLRAQLGVECLEQLEEYATVVWRGQPSEQPLEAHEHAWAP